MDLDNVVLKAFLQTQCVIKWDTQDDLERIADAVQDLTGQDYSRTYIRGYSKFDWPYMGCNAERNLFDLWRTQGSKAVYDQEEFLQLIGAYEDTQEPDISQLL